MPGIQAKHFFAGDGIAQVKFVDSHHVALRANSEQLALHRIQVIETGSIGAAEDRVERPQSAVVAAPRD